MQSLKVFLLKIVLTYCPILYYVALLITRGKASSIAAEAVIEVGLQPFDVKIGINTSLNKELMKYGNPNKQSNSKICMIDQIGSNNLRSIW